MPVLIIADNKCANSYRLAHMMGTSKMTDANHSHHPFFVDGKRYESEKAHVTGLEIKTIANVESNYQLYLEEEGDKPDKAIKDNETISLADRVKHFFAVPPATFG